MTETQHGEATYARELPVGILGADYSELRIRQEVERGDAVSIGQVVFRDRKRPEIAFVSPISGTVGDISMAPRRMLSVFEILPGPAASAEVETGSCDDSSAAAIRGTLLERGLWPAIVTRPFGGIPDPDASPDAIFVTATRTSTAAPHPANVMDGRAADLTRGLEVLAALTKGHVHLCQANGAPALDDVPSSVKISYFPDRDGQGLPGTHVHRLFPVHSERSVWTIGYQEVLAIGHLFRTGRYDPFRSVALHGPRCTDPAVLRIPLGVDLRVLVQDRSDDDDPPPDLISGSELRGRPAAYLGRHHDEITVTDRRRAASGARTGAPQPLFALSPLERALPMNILPVPMMRALSTGDAETARRLGCFELLEDDVAPLTALCTSGTDYGKCLRDVLDTLRKQTV